MVKHKKVVYLEKVKTEA